MVILTFSTLNKVPFSGRKGLSILSMIDREFSKLVVNPVVRIAQDDERRWTITGRHRHVKRTSSRIWQLKEYWQLGCRKDFRNRGAFDMADIDPLLSHRAQRLNPCLDIG